MQCTKELEERRNEWTRTLRITEYEPCYEEDYDVEDFLPHDSSSDALRDQEMVNTGWEKENTPSNCDGSEDENCNQGVNNDSDIKGKTECKQASVKSSVTDEKKESSKRRKKRLCPFNHSDNNSEARMKVKEDGREVSNAQKSGSNSDTGSYEDKSDSEWGGEAESTSSVETSDGIFGTFATWLQTADGGRKPEKMSKQHASQLNKMLSVIDPNKDLASLFNRKLIRDTFLKNHAENTYKPDTIKSYLLSLRYFCSFILTERPDTVNVDDASVHLIDEKARLWSSSYKTVNAGIWRNRMKIFLT